MNTTQKEKIEALLEELDLVEWDRFVKWDDWKYGEIFTLYGWIQREKDCYKDFLVVDFECLEDSETVKVGTSTTSSEEYSERINEMLYGEDSEHDQCRRVENYFEIENSIELGCKEVD